MLRLADDLELPLESVTRTFGLLAGRGAGKSNTGAVMAEEFFAAGLPFVAIDPVGSWYGMRSSGDGKSAGLPIPIFGGKHGDVPLLRTNGKELANLIASRRLTSIIDVSGFESEAAKKQFLLDFAQQLYFINSDPLHLFLEEADDYIPQKPQKDEWQLLRAWENIVRRGRARGLGMTVITQRSASINKSVLTQVETLFALRTTGPQDIAAIEEWIKYHQVGKEVLSSLAGLADGDAWVWSPSFLHFMKRVHIRRRRTYDSGATPKNFTGDLERPAATLSDVNVADLTKMFQATIDKAKADDPKELRRQLNIVTLELNRVKAKLPDPAKKPDPDPEWVAENKRLQEQVFELRGILKRVHALVVDYIEPRIDIAIPKLQETDIFERIPHRSGAAPPTLPVKVTEYRATGGVLDSKVHADPNLTASDRKILIPLAHSPEGMTLKELAVRSGYSKGGRFNNLVGGLRSRGYVTRGDPTMITGDGRSALGPIDPLPTGAELQGHWLSRLTESERRVLRPILDSHPHGMTPEQLRAETGYQAGGRFNNILGRLRSLGLVRRGTPIHADDTFFT